MAISTVVLITGTTRGLGKGLLELYLSKPEHTVIALNRDPSAEASQSLLQLPKGENSRLLVVKNDAKVPADATDAIIEVQKQGIDCLDIVIANAGIGYTFPCLRDAQITDLKAHFEINVCAVVSLFQACRPLLLKAKKPKWVTMGSSAGYIVNQDPVPSAAYGPSKVAIHWLTKRMDDEEENITAIVIDPGWVQTDMGNLSAILSGFPTPSLTIEDSVPNMVKVISEATKKTHGGKLWLYDGTEQQW